MSETNYHLKRRYVPAGRIFHLHCCRHLETWELRSSGALRSVG